MASMLYKFYVSLIVFGISTMLFNLIEGGINQSKKSNATGTSALSQHAEEPFSGVKIEDKNGSKTTGKGGNNQLTPTRTANMSPPKESNAKQNPQKNSKTANKNNAPRDTSHDQFMMLCAEIK